MKRPANVARATDPSVRGESLRRMWIAAASVALVTWLVVGGVLGIVLGVAAALLAARLIKRLEPADARRERQRIAADLPFAADLLAAAMRSGAPTEHAIRVVGDALGGPLGVRLVGVADAVALGLDPAYAWARLHSPRGGARLAETVTRSDDSGAAIARALHRLADDLRAARAAEVDAAAQRVGVLIVLPLGACFLPAFVFAGVAPVIVAVLGGVLR
jgi:Flp pilus assembly protein TadB